MLNYKDNFNRKTIKFAPHELVCIFSLVKRYTHFILAILLPIQIGLVSYLAEFPQLVETYYSNGIYPYISKFLRYGLGWLPFSVGDFLYTLLVILLIKWLFTRIRSGFKKPKQWLLEALATLSVLYFCFHLFWGFNYYRLPLHRSLQIRKDYTNEQLFNLAERLVEKTNAMHKMLSKNDTLPVQYAFKNHEIRKMAENGYDSIAMRFPKLVYNPKSVKPSLFSIPLSYMGFNGYLNPLTNEAQVNNQMPKFKLPSTTSHEIGHQIGFAKENEANFMACLTTMHHPNPYFRYAGYTFALKYCLSETYVADKCKTENLIAALHPGVMENYREVQKFWQEHQNPLEPFFKLFYSGYLKANNQPEGMQSYNYVVALLVNYYEGKSL